MTQCAVHRKHQDAPESYDRHHIVPKSWGGPSTPDNLAVLCPNGHRDVHVLLDILVMTAGNIPDWVKWRRWNNAMRKLAVSGYDRAVALELTPKRTL